MEQAIERVRLFSKLGHALDRHDESITVVMGGDWNCTTEFTVDRVGKEPHPASVEALKQLLQRGGVVDTWRECNQSIRQ